MTITKITTHIVSLPIGRELRTAIHRISATDNILVEIHTEDHVGIGYSVSFDRGQAMATRHAIHSLGAMLVGADERGIRAIAARMWSAINFTGASGINVMALSAIDTALWDLKGQQAGMPLFRLLGGEETDLQLYATGGWISYSVDELIDQGQQYRDEGYEHYKIKVGQQDWRKDVERVTALRAGVGDDFHLMVDANQGWTRYDARWAGEAFDELGVYWYEEPVASDDIAGAAELSQTLVSPIASGESVWGLDGFRTFIEGRGADIYMPDLMRVGGPTGFMDVAAVAAAHHQVVSTHCFTEVSAHLMSATPNARLIEYMPVWWDALFENAPAIAGGRVTLTEEPGLGFWFSAASKADYGWDEGWDVEPL